MRLGPCAPVVEPRIDFDAQSQLAADAEHRAHEVERHAVRGVRLGAHNQDRQVAEIEPLDGDRLSPNGREVELPLVGCIDGALVRVRHGKER